MEFVDLTLHIHVSTVAVTGRYDLVVARFFRILCLRP